MCRLTPLPQALAGGGAGAGEGPVTLTGASGEGSCEPLGGLRWALCGTPAFPAGPQEQPPEGPQLAFVGLRPASWGRWVSVVHTCPVCWLLENKHV